MENVMNNTSKVFESHIRIQMIASLSIEDLTYKQMKEILGCTDGNMTTHTREFDSCIHFSTNQIAQNVDYINAFEFFYCQIRQNKCRIM